MYGLRFFLQSEKMDGSAALAFELFSESENGIGPAVAAAANGMSSPRYRSLHPESPTATSGDFFETLTSSDFYKNTKVVFPSYLKLNLSAIIDYNVVLKAFGVILRETFLLALTDDFAGWRHIRVIPLGSISCPAKIELFLDNAFAAIQVQDEECSCG